MWCCRVQKTYSGVEKREISSFGAISPVLLLHHTGGARPSRPEGSLLLTERLSENEYAERLPNQKPGIGCGRCRFRADSLLEPRMSESVRQDLCDTAWLNVECECTWEALWTLYAIKTDWSCRVWLYAYSICNNGLGFKECVCECVYRCMFFLLPVVQPNEKIPVKSSANSAIIHPLYPGGDQIPSGVIDQNKTKIQTHTHKHTHTALSHWPTLCVCVCAVWLCRRSELTVLVASKLWGHSERWRPGSRCRTLSKL